MALGRDNLFILKLTAQGQITGGGAEADVTGPHAALRVKARLEKVVVTGTVAASTTACDIQIYAGNSKSGTAILSSAASLAGSGAQKANGTISNTGKQYADGQEFCMSENTTSSKTIDGLAADLYFRAEGV